LQNDAAFAVETKILHRETEEDESTEKTGKIRKIR